MSRCTKSAMVDIFARTVGFEVANSTTFCWIWGEAPMRPLAKFQYQVPISRQLLKPFLSEKPPGGKKDTIIWPRTPATGGISGSGLIPLTSLTFHSAWLADCVGFTSE